MEVQIEQIIYFVANGILYLLMGYILNRIKIIEERAESAVNEAEARKIINDKIQPLTEMQRKTEADLKRIEYKIDTMQRDNALHHKQQEEENKDQRRG